MMWDVAHPSCARRFLSFPKVLNDFQVFGLKFDGDLPIDGLVSVLSRSWQETY